MSSFEPSPSLFGQLIKLRGETIRWFKVQRCTCFDPLTGGHDTAHAVCGGSGFVRTEQDMTDKKVLIFNIAQTRVYADYGQQEVGKITVVALPKDFDPSENDEIIVTSRSLRAGGEILKRGTDDKLKHAPIASVGRVFSTSASAVTDYVEGTDYTIDLDTGAFTWIGGLGPSAGARYSVTYDYRPTYKLIQDIRRVRKTVSGVGLPMDTVWTLLTPTLFRG